MSRVVVLSGFLDPKELESVLFVELREEIERQATRFGLLESVKILRRTEGHQKPGRVFLQYSRLEAAILAKNTLKVQECNQGNQIQ